MFHCFICESVFDDNQQLVVHVQLSHANVASFCYAELDCLRAYFKLNSYKKNRFRKHKAIIRTQRDELKKQIKFRSNLLKPLKKNMIKKLALVKNQCDDIRSEINNRATQLGTNSILVTEINSFFEKNLQLFKALSTELRRFSIIKKHGTFIPPQSYALGNQEIFVEKEGKKELVNKTIVAQFIPIRDVFKKFFELPNILECTLKYIADAKKHSKIVKSIVQGSLSKEKSKIYKDKIVLPLVMFFDDYENNNPLGSYKAVSKCGVCYLSIPVLPPEFQAKIENIFLFILFNTKNRDIFRNKVIFSKAINGINALQYEDIPVINNNEEKRI